ncbi:ABC transporter substrate-binding protein [Streptomyces flavofungini]|uniref:Extracellular solute-binding protein n=1 Tax=Streptomyces flavofungini TaxID=68200 RepID=A0ABS0XDJ5_9ACTN|nr:extracellular solute-binding protein [Streptomyces flavofungini]MBJ3811071.1 extracellular solute-binding protein [Streptomyces flavofungini]GHC43674.1 sugar-binding protein [Streptomyces flavofungini]
MRYRTRTSRTAVVLAAVTTLAAGLLAGCAEDSDEDEPGGSSGGGGGGKGKTTLTVGVFGAFGLQEAGLYDEYEKLNPDINIKQNSVQRNENYWPALLTHLSSGSGLSDVQAVEVGNIAELTGTHASKLVDLGKTSGVDKNAYLDWKWQQGTTDDGKTIGLGTDIGPTGICYRKDLFKKAGLPTDREAVGKLWAGDWSKYLDAGKRYQKKAPKGTAFVDGATGVMAAVHASGKEKFYDAEGELIYQDSAGVQEGWDLAAQFAEAGLTAKLQQFQPSWDQAFSNGSFATVTCPPWMLGYIKDKAGDKGEDQWDVAAAPKPGNWGGSFLTVPEAGKNKEEAAKLVAWLTAPKQQAKLFDKRASFPSAEAAYGLPEVKDAKNPYFGDAPVGQVFAKAAEGVPVQPIGPKDGIISQYLADTGMLGVDQKGTSPDKAWDKAVKTIDNALDQ